jgi:hypothetical protein
MPSIWEALLKHTSYVFGKYFLKPIFLKPKMVTRNQVSLTSGCQALKVCCIYQTIRSLELSENKAFMSLTDCFYWAKIYLRTSLL